jgi:2Fe-2S iron-sulfur cluster protein
MTDWIRQANPRLYDVRAAVGKSRRDRWSTPRYRDRIALHDRIWLQIVGPDHPGIYYIATIVSLPYEKADAQFGRWHTDIQWDYRIDPPLLRSELLGDLRLEAFRPFRGFQGTNVPLPPEVASRLSELAGPRLMPFAGKEDPLSCLALAVAHDGAEVRTADGLTAGEALHPVQQAFIDHDAFQCGYCTPGQICSAVGMLQEAKRGWPSQSRRPGRRSGAHRRRDRRADERQSVPL